MTEIEKEKLAKGCLIFPFSRTNANAISALLASLDIHDELDELKTFLPKLKDGPEALPNEINKYTTIVLALSVFSTQLDYIKILIEKYRDFFKNKRILVIAGGPHPIGDPYSMLINGADLVCTGEGELVFREILIKFINNNSLEDINGTAFLDESGNLIRKPRGESVNLNDFPPFSVKRKLFRPIEITRGCGWKCRFCQIRSKGLPVKHRSVDQVLIYVKEIKKYFTRRRPDIRFISPNALSYGSKNGIDLDLSQVENLLHGIREIIGSKGRIFFGSFPSEVRPETINEKSVQILKKYSNVTKIVIGGQSGSNRILELSDRGHNAEETERATKLLLDNGFDVNVDIIFGLPGERRDDIELTIQHMRVLTNYGATIHSHTFMPLVGTPFANKNPGKINSQYVELITDLQRNRKLSGQHKKQEKHAKTLAERRKLEKQMKHKKSIM